MKPRMPTSRNTAPTSAASDWMGVRSRMGVSSLQAGVVRVCPRVRPDETEALLAGLVEHRQGRREGVGAVVGAVAAAAVSAAAVTASTRAAAAAAAAV